MKEAFLSFSCPIDDYLFLITKKQPPSLLLLALITKKAPPEEIPNSIPLNHKTTLQGVLDAWWHG
jgi:hypothetical protein